LRHGHRVSVVVVVSVSAGLGRLLVCKGEQG
jgi:hypothetical protein